MSAHLFKKLIPAMTVLFGMLLFLPVGLPGILGVHTAKAAVSSWQKGVTLVPTYTTDFSSSNFRQSLANAAAMHANYAILEIPLYQSSPSSSDIQTGGDTPTDQSLTDAVHYAKSLGMNTAFKMHLYTWDKAMWAAYINASDRSAWFAAYTAKLNHYGALAQQLGVQEMIIGNELINMTTSTSDSTNTQHWLDMIAGLRAIYSGKLTYNANWGGCYFCDEKNHIDFWGSLDYIGISAYFNLSDDLLGSWDGANKGDIGPLQQRFGKPVLFTEIGYLSTPGAHTAPWNSGMNNGVDQQEQANDYTALFQYWNSYSYMQGLNIWNWETDPNAGGNSVSYTPQNKTAQGIISNWFAGGTTPSPANNPPPAQQSFSTSGTAPANVTAGQQSTFSFTVTSTNQSNVLVDAEMYDSSNSKVFQQFWSGQNFTAGQSQSYSFNWQAPNAASYTLKVGVFANDWSQNYYWNGNVYNVNAAAANSQPPPTNPPPTNPPPVNNPPPPTNNPPPSNPQANAGTVNVWWPTNGASVSGVQPFKAMLTNNSVNSYKMSWQVDNGQLNQMYNSNQDYPHKEAVVDLSGWNWQPSGNYNLNFVATDLSGMLLGQQQVTIHVVH